MSSVNLSSPILIVLLSAPTTPLAWHGYRLAETLKQQQRPFRVFFYQDAAFIAHQQRWHPQDQLDLTLLWQQLEIDLPVCVSAALQRGVTDSENAERHQLTIPTLATGFRLVGLGHLSEALLQCKHMLQF